MAVFGWNVIYVYPYIVHTVQNETDFDLNRKSEYVDDVLNGFNNT